MSLDTPIAQPDPMRPVPGLSRLAQDLLPALYQHRLVATSQLHRLFTPHARRPVYLRQQLATLRADGLVDATTRRTSRLGRAELLWYITARGADAVAQDPTIPRRGYRISPQTAASQLQEHTLTVVDTGVAFVDWARRLGDECSPLDWEPEVAHRIRDGESRGADEAFMIPDAVLRYTHATAEGRRRMLSFFIEVDRATMQTTRLAAKLAAYARYQHYVPNGGRRSRSVREAWRDRYPAFPRLLIVLTGASDRVLANRIQDLRALAAADPHVSQLTAGVTTLQLLQELGPFAPVMTPLSGDTTPTDVFLAPTGGTRD
ncbi:replication-relaxation family protein (plasmid) [Streptomyces sp. NBC_00053]|uniref:replication-relaxation family protein n=1 Tax=unclassified Streptomyces TaxID=2593676 RepID=UPI0022565D6D|nr:MULTISPECIES: replication-relaxation family protein [unclassified Streptomyces]MCX4399947.1 replication-relaxation family protein [Streptomyces sp. NBC_01767]MCX5506049.1 replication-relaxation family protein [Streptomyces sp. NBC_00052]MCX5554296.1 replication-relaxation family protein [Streptomyces sp. NBC_00051]WSP52952.1 replication-relaxation family protein [Streptomyces sp. NBC_01243]